VRNVRQRPASAACGAHWLTRGHGANRLASACSVGSRWQVGCGARRAALGFGCLFESTAVSVELWVACAQLRDHPGMRIPIILRVDDRRDLSDAVIRSQDPPNRPPPSLCRKVYFLADRSFFAGACTDTNGLRPPRAGEPHCRCTMIFRAELADATSPSATRTSSCNSPTSSVRESARRTSTRAFSATDRVEHGSAVVELGMFDGGSIAFWFQHFDPDMIVGVDLAQREDSAYFRAYLTRPRRQRIKTYWGTNQADQARLRERRSGRSKWKQNLKARLRVSKLVRGVVETRSIEPPKTGIHNFACHIPRLAEAHSNQESSRRGRALRLVRRRDRFAASRRRDR
jgi:hypothetical protein